MTIVGVVSAKASPGATTTALVLAATLPGPVLLVEADQSGGSLGARFGLSDEPGLRTLAVRSRRGLDPATVVEHAQPIGDVDVLIGPATADEAAAVLSTVAVRLAEALGSAGRTVIIDVGRCRPSSPAWPLLTEAKHCVLVCRPRLDEYRPAAALAAELVAANQQVGLVCVGAEPYAPSEFAMEAGIELLGVLPEDPQAAAGLRGEPISVRGLQRSRLWMAGEALADRLSTSAGVHGSAAAAPVPMVGVEP